MSADLDHDECLEQFVLGMGCEHFLEFGVNGVKSSWRNAQVDDARPEIPDKDKSSEVPVTRYEDAPLLRCDGENL